MIAVCIIGYLGLVMVNTVFWTMAGLALSMLGHPVTYARIVPPDPPTKAKYETNWLVCALLVGGVALALYVAIKFPGAF